MHSLVSVSDLLAKHNRFSSMLFTTSIDNEGGEELEEEELEEGTVQTDAMDSLNTWTDHSFIKPFRAITELSGFPALTWLYRILVTLAVTSSSAERAMSRLKIIKSRLRSSMLDDWLSSLMMILASEKDIVEMISIEDIINTFAGNSAPLQKLLLN